MTAKDPRVRRTPRGATSRAGGTAEAQAPFATPRRRDGGAAPFPARQGARAHEQAARAPGGDLLEPEAPAVTAFGERTPYPADRHAWAREQAALLRAGRLDEVDAANVAEVLREAELAEYDKLESALRVLLMHMLKWDHQPERRGRSWEATIRTQRKIAAKVLRKNPSLKSSLGEAIAEAWDEARSDASGETDLPLSAFPEAIPYDWAAITEQPFDYDPPPAPRRRRR